MSHIDGRRNRQASKRKDYRRAQGCGLGDRSLGRRAMRRYLNDGLLTLRDFTCSGSLECTCAGCEFDSFTAPPQYGEVTRLGPCCTAYRSLRRAVASVIDEGASVDDAFAAVMSLIGAMRGIGRFEVDYLAHQLADVCGCCRWVRWEPPPSLDHD